MKAIVATQQFVGTPSETLNTLQISAESTHNDGTFYNTIANSLNSKANSVDVYTNG